MMKLRKEALSFNECSHNLDSLIRLFSKEVEFPGKKGGMVSDIEMIVVKADVRKSEIDHESPDHEESSGFSMAVLRWLNPISHANSHS